MSSSEYIADFNSGFVRDLGYRSELESVAYDIEEDAARDELSMEDRVRRAMDRLLGFVDGLFSNAGLDCLNNLAVQFITRMVAEAMIAQRDQTVECFEPTGRAETAAESLAKQHRETDPA
jgi:hypothetical protein